MNRRTVRVHVSSRRGTCSASCSRRQVAALGAAAPLVVASLVLSACGGGGSGSSQSGGYTIGAMADLSGPTSNAGVPLIAGIRAAVSVANGKGGVNGHKIRLIVRDDGADSSKGVTQARALVTGNKVAAVLGLNSSVSGSAVAPFLAQAKTPVIGSGLPASLVEPARPFIFSQKTDFNTQGALQAQFVAQQAADGALPKNPRVAILYYSTPAGTGWRDAAIKRAKQLNLPVVAVQGAETTATSFDAQAAKIAAANPDAVLIFVSMAPAVVSSMQHAGLSPSTLLVEFDALDSTALLKTVKWQSFAALSEVKDATSGTGPAFRDMQNGARAVHVDPNTPSFPDGYMQGLIIVDALKKCGYPCSGSKLNSALEQVSFTGGGLTWGPYKYSPTRHTPITTVSFERWDGTKNTRAPVGGTITVDQ